MKDISKINDKLDGLISKYNIVKPLNTQSQTLSLDQAISLLAGIETKYKFDSKPSSKPNSKLNFPKTKYTILQDLVTKLEYELCVKESKNVDFVLNEIIGCLKSETPEAKKICSDQINKMLETNYFNSNIKNKLKSLIGLMA